MNVIHMPASEESLMRSSCKAAGEMHVSCRSLVSVIPPVAICVPGLHPSTTTSRCEMCIHVRKDSRGESTSAHFHRSSKLLNCFTEVQQKELHPNKMLFCLLLFFMFSRLSQGWNGIIQIQLLLSVMYPLVNTAFGHLFPDSLFH